MNFRWLCIILVLLMIGVGATQKRSAVISGMAGTVTVTRSGAYTLTTSAGMTFAGQLTGAAKQITRTSGSDGIGPYNQIGFTYQHGARLGSIRLYSSRPIALFEISYPQGGPNTDPFPEFSSYPQLPHHLSYLDSQFSPFSFSDFGTTAPWAEFDSAGNCWMLSAASDFMVASTARGASGSIQCGINTGIEVLPAGLTHRTILVFDKGPNKTFSTWGNALTDLQGKTRPTNDADPGLKYLGYWTDNGASYYYNYDESLGYAGTLLAVRDYFRQIHVQLGYMQLDSWWYPKGADAHWTAGDGIYEYTAHPSLFPEGLKSFQQQLGLPLITHARWIDPASPYRTTFKMSNNVVIDPQYWQNIAGYLNDSGVVGYEQDWLDMNATAANNLNDQESFMGNMANYCNDRGISLQYCMPTPRHYLQSSRYNNAYTVRVSPDRFDRSRWDQALYSSMLASALGLWPWVDVFQSNETSNILLATLSAGMVGVGDQIGSANTDNLLKSVRGDGTIVKPDRPLVPIDSTILADAIDGPRRPMVAAAFTDFGSTKAAYVFTYVRDFLDNSVSFTPASLGFTGNVYVYDYAAGTGTVMDAAQSFTRTISDWAYYVVVPIGPSGIAFLGDGGQFVILGKQRIASVADSGNLTATVTLSAGEASRTLFGYAPEKPSVAAEGGDAGPVEYDSLTGLFEFQIRSTGPRSVQITVTDPSS